MMDEKLFLMILRNNPLVEKLRFLYCNVGDAHLAILPGCEEMKLKNLSVGGILGNGITITIHGIRDIVRKHPELDTLELCKIQHNLGNCNGICPASIQLISSNLSHLRHLVLRTLPLTQRHTAPSTEGWSTSPIWNSSKPSNSLTVAWPSPSSPGSSRISSRSPPSRNTSKPIHSKLRVWLGNDWERTLWTCDMSIRVYNEVEWGYWYDMRI